MTWVIEAHIEPEGISRARVEVPEGGSSLAVELMETVAKHYAHGEELPRMVPLPSTPKDPQVAVTVGDVRVRLSKAEAVR